MKFSIRDLFWLVLVCALVVAWWVERRQRPTLQQRIFKQWESEWQNNRTSKYRVVGGTI